MIYFNTLCRSDIRNKMCACVMERTFRHTSALILFCCICGHRSRKPYSVLVCLLYHCYRESCTVSQSVYCIIGAGNQVQCPSLSTVSLVQGIMQCPHLSTVSLVQGIMYSVLICLLYHWCRESITVSQPIYCIIGAGNHVVSQPIYCIIGAGNNVQCPHLSTVSLSQGIKYSVLVCLLQHCHRESCTVSSSVYCIIVME